MLLDLGVTSGAGFHNVTKFSELAEKLGFHRLWIGEDINAPYDIFTLASTLMLRTSNIKVGIGITSPLIRNITTIARASVTLTEIGGDDRFVLGVGVGGLQDLAKLGISITKPKAMLRDAVVVLRKIWNGETVTFKSEHFQLQNFHIMYGLGYRIPVYLGVRGPRLLELAGELADGVILSGPKKYLAKAVDLVKESIKKSEKPERAFKFIVWTPTVLTEKETDVNLAKRSIAFVLADTPTNVLEMAELELEKVDEIKRAFQRSGLEKAAHLVTEGLVNEVALNGSVQQLVKQVQSLESLGVDEVVFGPPYGFNKEHAVKQLAKAWRAHA